MAERDPYHGIDPTFAARLKAMVDASGGRIILTGGTGGNRAGYRSPADQEALWQDALRKYGSPEAARKWVAQPGRGKGSNHQHGMAYDLSFANDEGRAWAHQNAVKFGLFFPMSWEPWHIQPLATALEENPEAYTDPPVGVAPALDPTDPETQLLRMFAAIDADLETAFAGGETMPGVDMDAVGPAGGQVVTDEGAQMLDFGFRSAPDQTEQAMEEMMGDGDGS